MSCYCKYNYFSFPIHVCIAVMQTLEYPDVVSLCLVVGPSLVVGPLSHVDFKKWQCRMSLSLIFPNVTCQIQGEVMPNVTKF